MLLGREKQILEAVGCAVDHVQTFVHRVSLYLAD